MIIIDFQGDGVSWSYISLISLNSHLFVQQVSEAYLPFGTGVV
jgi:hypothetical protein